MLGAILVVLACVVILPMAFMMLGAAISALLGFFLYRDAEITHPGSELLETNY